MAAVRSAQFAAGVLDMLVDRLWGLAGELGDLLGLETLADQGQAFEFSRGEAGFELRWDRCRHDQPVLRASRAWAIASRPCRWEALRMPW